MTCDNSDRLAHFPVSLAFVQVTWSGKPEDSPVPDSPRIDWTLHLGQEESGLSDLGQALTACGSKNFF